MFYQIVNTCATSFGKRDAVQYVMPDKTVRIQKLKAVLKARHIEDRDRASYLTGQLGSTVGYWSGLLAGDRSFGEKMARRIEEGLKLPRSYLDDVGLSADAMEVAELFDQLDEHGRKVLRATAHALMPAGEPPPPEPAGPRLTPMQARAARLRKHDA